MLTGLLEIAHVVIKKNIKETYEETSCSQAPMYKASLIIFSQYTLCLASIFLSLAAIVAPYASNSSIIVV